MNPYDFSSSLCYGGSSNVLYFYDRGKLEKKFSFPNIHGSFSSKYQKLPICKEYEETQKNKTSGDIFSCEYLNLHNNPSILTSSNHRDVLLYSLNSSVGMVKQHVFKGQLHGSEAICSNVLKNNKSQLVPHNNIVLSGSYGGDLSVWKIPEEQENDSIIEENSDEQLIRKRMPTTSTPLFSISKEHSYRFDETKGTIIRKVSFLYNNQDTPSSVFASCGDSGSIIFRDLNKLSSSKNNKNKYRTVLNVTDDEQFPVLNFSFGRYHHQHRIYCCCKGGIYCFSLREKPKFTRSNSIFSLFDHYTVPHNEKEEEGKEQQRKRRIISQMIDFEGQSLCGCLVYENRNELVFSDWENDVPNIIYKVDFRKMNQLLGAWEAHSDRIMRLKKGNDEEDCLSIGVDRKIKAWKLTSSDERLLFEISNDDKKGEEEEEKEYYFDCCVIPNLEQRKMMKKDLTERLLFLLQKEKNHFGGNENNENTSSSSRRMFYCKIMFYGRNQNKRTFFSTVKLFVLLK